MIKDEIPGVRRAALKALVGIRQAGIRKEAQEGSEGVSKEGAEEQKSEIDALASAVPQAWSELAPEPLPAAELVNPASPEHELRLDGRSFSFTGK
jgi:hypothetical protein